MNNKKRPRKFRGRFLNCYNRVPINGVTVQPSRWKL